jgi:hypothetical protein
MEIETASGRNKRVFDRIRIGSSKTIWNLSEGGAYVVTSSPRRLGSVIHFEYKLWKDEAPFRALAKVVRILHCPNTSTGKPAGMALQFVKVSVDDRIRLRTFLKQQTGQNFPATEGETVPDIPPDPDDGGDI